MLASSIIHDLKSEGTLLTVTQTGEDNMPNDCTPRNIMHIILGALLIAYIPSLQITEASVAKQGTGEISGSVCGYSSESIHAHVVALLLQTYNGYPWFAKECDAPINDVGYYSCPGLPRGYYLFYATPEEDNGIKSGQSGIDHFSRTFYPGTVDVQQAELVYVKAGTTSTYNFVLEQASTYQIKGRIAGKPASAVLSLSSVDQLRGFLVDTSAKVVYDSHSGEFAVDGVSSGSYSLDGHWFIAAPDQRSQIPQSGTIDIGVADDDVQGLLLAARTHATIEGTIDRDGNDPGKTTKIELQDIADVHRKIAAEVSPDGSFYFPNVASGSYMINGIDLENGYVKMVSVNGRESAIQQVMVPPGQSQVSLRVRLGLKGAVIEGAVTDFRQNASGINVMAKNEATGAIYTSTADSIGRFTIANLPPGEYDLYAWDHLDEIPYAIPRGVDKYRDEKVVVSVDEGQTVNGISIPLLNRTGPS